MTSQLEIDAVARAYDPAVSRARQALYRFAAASLADPRGTAQRLLYDEQARRVAIDAAAILQDEEAFVAMPLAQGELPLAALDPARVLAELPDSPAELNQLYETTFGLLTTGSVTPYETEYIPSKFVFQRSNGLADVAGFYQAFGVQPSSREPERHDHIVVELEFMASLITLERLAEEVEAADSSERAAVCRQGQARFLGEHLAWWVPAFARLLSHSASDTFYQQVGKFLAALIAAERAYLGVPAARTLPHPTAIERPDECSGCELAGAGVE
jgi:TorA maturation chaperone TorD